ncbi:MAG: hypothetical protein MUC59_15010, partial [Saprospiraceae bacterium]|nr:hypothetical protein [Saprospiraceae bacterium]
MAPNRLFGHVGDTLTQTGPLPVLPNCTEMYVDISTACLAPCTSSDYYVKYCNFGDETALNASVSVSFDATFTINSASFPFTDQGNNVYLFHIGDVPAGDCGSFSININLDCGAEIGQAHCVDAQIFPQSTCTPTSPNWDGSDIGLAIECQGDSIYFTLTNTGTGDMNQPSQCIIIEDDLIVMVSGY